MRFYLDHDIDARVCKMLELLGHTAWTANQAGLATADDVDQSIYAASRGAVLVTQDRELTRRLRKRTINQTVSLRCEAPDVVQVLRDNLDEIIAILEHRSDVVIIASKAQVRPYCEPWPG